MAVIPAVSLFSDEEDVPTALRLNRYGDFDKLVLGERIQCSLPEGKR